MTTNATTTWLELNQRYLTAALAGLRDLLHRHTTDAGGPCPDIAGREPEPSPASIRAEMTAPPPLEDLANLFGLSAFEQSVLLLCAGVELDSSFASLYAAAQGDPRRNYPTFSLALAALPEAHWSALSPTAPLRYWRMVELTGRDGLTAVPLRIDERILHYLTGIQCTDERLRGFIRPAPAPGELVASHAEIVRRAVEAWAGNGAPGPAPVLQLYGADAAGQRPVAAAIAAGLGINLQLMPAHLLPVDSRELEALMRLWEREAALTRSALLLDCAGVDAADRAKDAVINRFIEETRSAMVLAGRERRSSLERPSFSLEVHKPAAAEQRSLWEKELGAGNVNGCLGPLVSQFNLSASVLHSVCDEALHRARGSERRVADVVWDVCRVQARPKLEELAQPITPAAGWDDLVLPDTARQLLHEIEAHVRQRLKVYETWGFGAHSSKGSGITALFSGPSGTGKTMAAEVLAKQLRLDLYRIDLSQVVSKYIGETEKNLSKIFAVAEDSAVILLFDEADALFGKRSEVKDSHDRYANIEISYLLQRMEAYRGLAVLTTNMKEALDSAFLRRIRFVVQFPFPNFEQRADIWRRIFPAATPTEGLDVTKLARLNVAGGNIQNIALYAAFLAADAGQPVRMSHLLRAARVEYAKLEKPLTDAEIRGWL